MRNHYVPQYYTSRWADPSTGKLWLYYRPHKEVIVRPKLPVQVGWGEDIYTIPFVDDETRYVLETVFFKKVDQRGSDVLSKLERDIQITLEDRRDWAVTVLALKQRHPVKLADLARQMADQIVEELIEAKATYFRQRPDSDQRSWEEYLQDEESDKWIERQKVTAIRHAILLPRTMEWIASADWSLISLPENSHRFLTCDRPVIMTNGLLSSSAHVAMPVGPRTLWVAANKHTTNTIGGNPRLAATVNDLIVRQAHSYVFGLDDRQQRFVSNRLCREMRELS